MKFKALFLILIVTLFACSPNGSLADKIFDEMDKKFGEQISLSINDDKYLTISLINSKKNNLTDNEKEKYANEIALDIYDNVVQKNRFVKISIKYKIQINAIIVQNIRTIAQFDFAVADLEKASKKQ